MIYVRRSSGQTGTEVELLRKSIEDRGDGVIAAFTDDPGITGKSKYAGWHKMVTSLENVDNVVVGCVADLPGRKAADLFKILDLLRDHSVSLRLNHESIDSGAGSAATLDLIAAYRAAKLSDAIRRGISRARAAGKVIGRPAVPDHVRRRIEVAIVDGGGIRPTARRFGVSPASVINIRRMMRVEPKKLAA